MLRPDNDAWRPVALAHHGTDAPSPGSPTYEPQPGGQACRRALVSTRRDAGRVAVAQAAAPAGGVRAGVVHLREVRGSLGLELERFQPAARELSRHGSDGGRRDVAARATGAAPHAAPDAGRPPRRPVHGRLSARANTGRAAARRHVALALRADATKVVLTQ